MTLELVVKFQRFCYQKRSPFAVIFVGVAC